MPKNTQKGPKLIRNNTKSGIDSDVDALFKLPLTEFTDARNALATQLKKSGRTGEATVVKALAKPSVSAWAVNQLYWDHRDAFDELVEVGEQLQELQTSGISGKVNEMRAALEARRSALTQLSDLATTLLEDAGHSPSPDTLRRVSSTLEALSSRGASDDGPTPGRLSTDVDPPGFESLTSFIPGSFAVERKSTKKPEASKPHLKLVEDAKEKREREETRHADIAVAKASVQLAKKTLADARAKVLTLEALHKKHSAESKQAEKTRREAEERLRKVSAVADELAERAQSTAEEFATASESLSEAKRDLDQATKELESLL